jgi:hypothetical protein
LSLAAARGGLKKNPLVFRHFFEFFPVAIREDKVSMVGISSGTKPRSPDRRQEEA